jgi:hypothetical protein
LSNFQPGGPQQFACRHILSMISLQKASVGGND